MKNTNIAFLLTPKAEVEYLYEDFTVRQALEKMEYHRYAMIPVLERASGKYLYSLSEGDLLWAIKDRRLDYDGFEKLRINKIVRHRAVNAVPINCPVEDVYGMVMAQNFVPIVDDLGTFIGIVTRRKVLRAILDNE